jgi:hypothetical protein
VSNLELPNFNETMTFLASKFAEELQNALEKPYPYAPGFKRQRAPFGTSPKIATGGLINSISVTYNSSDQEIVVEMADYWKYVNDGRRPGKYAPLDSIKDWIKAKGLKGRNKKTGRFITNESFAWGINTNIKKFGIAPTYFYDTAFINFEKYFEDEAVQALGIDVETFFEKVFEQNI